MAITLQRLCKDSNYLYGMRMLAGFEGMNNIVKWVHTLEDVEVSEFLHGGELIFSTGIANEGTRWLLPFIKNLCKNQASGLVVNLGPYVPTIPDEVIEYCNENKFPLFDLPWKTHLVDITRDFCNQIIQNDKAEKDTGSIFESIIYNPADTEKYAPLLEKQGFDVDGSYCIIGYRFREGSNIHMFAHTLTFETEKIIFGSKGGAAGFESFDMKFYVLCNFGKREISSLVNRISEIQNRYGDDCKTVIVVGPSNGRLETLSKDFKKVCSLEKWAVKKNISPMYYEDQGVKRILFSVDDPVVLREYYNEVLLPLEKYDSENGTNYLEFLREYLDNDGSVKKIAENSYVHRNTINYQLGKIRNILGNDMKSLDTRVNLILAFQIRDILY